MVLVVVELLLVEVDDDPLGVVVVVDGAWDVVVGASSANGGGTFGPLRTYTAIPLGIAAKSQSAEVIGTRTQPCEAGVGGIEREPWTAIFPLKYDGE